MQFYDFKEADHFFIQSKYFFRYMLKKNSIFVYILPREKRGFQRLKPTISP